jgi:hypothetical protein
MSGTGEMSLSVSRSKATARAANSKADNSQSARKMATDGKSSLTDRKLPRIRVKSEWRDRADDNAGSDDVEDKEEDERKVVGH